MASRGRANPGRDLAVLEIKARTTMKTNLIRTFLDGRRQPLAASAETTRLLDELCRQAPEFCAQVLADTTTHGTQKAQLLAGLVGSDVDRQQIAQALRQLSDIEFLQVLDGLRQPFLAQRAV